ncbi:MAG: hypothetical protein ACXVMS_05590 [Flavisolibacter sp.]
MAEKNLNQDNQRDQSIRERDQKNTQSGEGKNTNEQNINVNNPQSGNEWSNYRTRELSGKENRSGEEEGEE